MKHFFDVGAHIGQTFNWLPQTAEYDGYHIWCFEPSIRHLGALRQRCLDVKAGHERGWEITICPFALSNKTGWTSFYEKNDHFGDSLFPELYVFNDYVANSPTAPKILCPTINAADFITREIPPIDRIVMKIDAEGSEYDILESVLGSPDASAHIEKFILEFHGINSPLDKQTDLDTRKANLLTEIEAAKISLEYWTL